ncbi:biopolymer transporter ExbD, partial [Enterococcus casseliflavus]
MAGSSMRGGRPRKFKSEINVVPYIDVMLVLLIIFMVATPITNPSVINLPTAGKSTQPPSD